MGALVKSQVLRPVLKKKREEGHSFSQIGNRVGNMDTIMSISVYNGITKDGVVGYLIRWESNYMWCWDWLVVVVDVGRGKA